MRPVLIAGCLLALLSATQANATVTVCSNAAARKYGYGVKLREEFPTNLEASELDRQLAQYASKSGFFFTSEGALTPERTYSSWNGDLSSPSDDVSINLKLSASHPNKAEVTVETFSYHCGATEDWKPYWQKFMHFVHSRGLIR